MNSLLTKTLAVAAVAIMAPLAVAAGNTVQQIFPGESDNEDVTFAEGRAEKAFEAKDYQTAFRLYRETLAPAGDKYAQYMLGVMYANGNGVEQNAAKAAAWFSLASQRGNEQLLAFSNDYQSNLTESQLDAARRELAELKATLGDVAVLERLIAKDERWLNEQTGSRMKSRGCNIPGRAVDPRGLSTGGATFDQICKNIQERIAYRQQYIDNYEDFANLGE